MIARVIRTLSAVFVVVYMCEAAAGLRAGAQPAAGSISGRVVDWNGAMPGVAIRGRPAGDPAPRAFEAITDTDGAFAIPNLGAGDYELQVMAPASETTTDRRVHVAAAQITPLTIEIYRGCDTFADERGSTTNTDLREVIGLAIHESLNGALPYDDVHVFSTANVPRDVDLAKVLPRGWEVLTPQRIRARADLRDGVSYLKIGRIHARGGCIAVAIDEAVEPRKPAPHIVLLGGAGLMNEYRRTPGGWQKKRVYLYEI